MIITNWGNRVKNYFQFDWVVSMFLKCNWIVRVKQQWKVGKKSDMQHLQFNSDINENKTVLTHVIQACKYTEFTIVT